MSWNGTVYCSYCGDKGHNHRGCPKRKADEERILKEEPDSYYAKSIMRQREYNEYSKKFHKTRTCSYCDKPGHNRRTCELRKKDQELVQQRFDSYRIQFAEAIREAGLVPGALVRCHYERWGAISEAVGLVEKINWDNVSHKYCDIDITGHHRSGDFCVDELGVISYRVLSVTDKGNSAYSRLPKPGELRNVQAKNLVMLFPDLFKETYDKAHCEENGRMLSNLRAVKLDILGTADSSNMKDPDKTEITEGVKKLYNLYNKKTSSTDSISRRRIGHAMWQRVRKEEHEEYWRRAREGQ